MGRSHPSVVPADTTREAWRVQVGIIAAMPIERRVAEWEAFNEALAEMEDLAVRRRHPEFDDRQVFRQLVRQRYGDELVALAWPSLMDCIHD